MSLAPLKGVMGGCWGLSTITTIGPGCALHAPVRQDGLDRDQVTKLIES
jgi:hypothetical protein